MASVQHDIVPFTVPSLTAQQQTTLQDRLSTATYPNELETNVGWEYGAPSWAVKSMADTWQTYDFEVARQEINSWKHYRTKIDDLNIHFIHEPSSDPDAMPILLCHGWPSTFYEFHKVINALRDGGNGNQAFHVVVPSLPGFGFSDAPTSPGYGVAKMADMMNALMVKLGYTRYVWHGGDWGAIIGKYVAAHYTKHCKAFHTSLPFVLPPLPTPRNIVLHPIRVLEFFSSLVLGFDTMYGKGKTVLNWATFANAELYYGCGYRAIQGTRPYTLAYGLSDSPLGMMGWMLEKYHEWTYHQDDKTAAGMSLPPTITPDEFLTQVTLYYMTNSMSSSIRIYYECLHHHEMIKVVLPRVSIPTAISNFATDVAKMPKAWLETATHLVHYKEHDTGGHFPGLEVATLLVDDIQQFGNKLRKHRKTSKL